MKDVLPLLALVVAAILLGAYIAHRDNPGDPPGSRVEADGSITFDVVEYRSANGHRIRCLSPRPGKMECY